MLKELGRQAEAVTYFDGIRSTAAHKFDSQFSVQERQALLRLAYNGLNEPSIITGPPEAAYLSRD